MKTFTFDIRPVPKPRMTRSDKWKKRPIVTHYYAYKDLLKLQANKLGLKHLTDKIEIHCTFKVLKSWSKKKQQEMIGKPYQVKDRNDDDNLIKSVQDILEKSDSHIYDVRLTKHWAEKDSLTIVTY